MTGDVLDQLVVGAGLRGLTAGLRVRREHPEALLGLVDAAPQPGGSIRTQRSNGFACELGPFAFTADEVGPVLGLLQQPPSPIAAMPAAQRGWLFTGAERQPLAVDPPPVSFRTGNEELVQACRRELGPSLRLGRAATALRAVPSGFEVDLAGEVPSTLVAPRLALALPVAAASALLGPFDHALAAVASRLTSAPRAFAFFGGHQSDLPELRGYGIVPAAGVDGPAVEMIFCSQVFAGRALQGRCLVRVELLGPLLAEGDGTVLAAAEAEVRRWTGARGRLPFAKLHRFAAEVVDAAHAECRARLSGLAARIAGLAIC